MTFDLKNLNTPKIQTAGGEFPAFFAICQTAINQTQWKGSQLETVQFVKGQLEALRQHCASLGVEEPLMKNEIEEDGVEIEAPQVAEPTHSEPAPEQPKAETSADEKKK